MANLPKSHNSEPKRKINKDVLLWGIFVVFVVVSLAGLVAIDVVGEARMGNHQHPADAAEK
jgi:hypothetical protein